MLQPASPLGRTTALLLGTTSSARSKSRTSRRLRLAPSPRRPRRPRPSRRTRPRPSRRPRSRTRCRRHALSTSAPSPSSASPLRADSRCVPASLVLAPCTVPLAPLRRATLGCLFGTRLAMPRASTRTHPASLTDHASSNWRRVTCVPAPRAPAPTRTSRLPKLTRLKAAAFRLSGCLCFWLPAWVRSGCKRRPRPRQPRHRCLRESRCSVAQVSQGGR